LLALAIAFALALVLYLLLLTQQLFALTRSALQLARPNALAPCGYRKTIRSQRGEHRCADSSTHCACPN
jgi:hypothetical protein